MSTTELNKSLFQVLADTYALYLKTQNYHWNVTGPNFKSLHLLFEEQYQELAEAVDTIAERIRILGSHVQADFKTFAQIATVTEGNAKKSAKEMLEELYADQGKVLVSVQQALKIAQNLGEEGSIALLTDRILVHEKAAWMLHASF